MKREAFDAQHKSKQTALGLPPPVGDHFFYGCNLCGDVIPSSAAESESCSCGNLFVDVKFGGVAIETVGSVSLLEVYP